MRLVLFRGFGKVIGFGQNTRRPNRAVKCAELVMASVSPELSKRSEGSKQAAQPFGAPEM